MIVSFVTIIGWAWVIKFTMQWICRNVRGTARFEFTATGLSVLWRTLVFALLSALVIPIPWILRWYTTWYISQVSVVNADGSYCLNKLSERCCEEIVQILDLSVCLWRCWRAIHLTHRFASSPSRDHAGRRRGGIAIRG